MTHFIKPPHLQKGDTIGIVSPSSAITNFPRRLQRGISSLEALGLKVILAPNSQKASGHAAGAPQERADDIHSMFRNPEIKGIICSTGGYNANAVLPLLDYELIRSNPKVFCGYSDITALNVAITHKAGLVTFNGPTVLPTFGEYDGPFEFTLRNFLKAVFENKAMGELEHSDITSDENLWWGKDDDRRRKTVPASAPVALTAGKGEGTLLGGNLETLTILGGTKFLPDYDDTILFLEEMEGGTDSVERNLDYLEQLGVFKKVRGLIYGKPYQFSTISPKRSLETILTELGNRYGIPVIYNVDCGHTNPMLTMPLGVHAIVDADNTSITITESATV